MLPWMVLVSPLVIGPHGAAFPAFGQRALAQRCQDHAHVRRRGRGRVPAPALARNGRQACVPGLRLHGLLCVPAAVRPAAMALQGVPPRRLDHLGHLVRLAQAAAPVLPARRRPPSATRSRAALALSRDLDVQCKTAWVLTHKLREAMATEVRGYKLGGVGKRVEVDGARAVQRCWTCCTEAALLHTRGEVGV